MGPAGWFWSVGGVGGLIGGLERYVDATHQGRGQTG